MTDWNPSKEEHHEQSAGSVGLLEQPDTRLARDIMQYGVVTVKKHESVYTAIGLLADKGISGLPVVNEDRLIGVISEKDVLKLLLMSEYLPGLVEAYMTTDVVTFDVEDQLTDICDCFVNNSFRRVPIVHNGALAGVITRADLIKANRYRWRSRQSHARRKEDVRAQDVMKCGLLTVQRDTRISEAVDILATHGISGLPVVDAYLNLQGIVSEKDLLKRLYDPAATDGWIEDVMTESVVSFSQDDTLTDICECLINNDFRRVPILDNGKLVGLISRADLMVYILKNKSTMFRR